MDTSDYREQDGCRNCEHCFTFTEYDQGDQYYCTVGAPKRPRCMSMAMKEYYWMKEGETTDEWGKHIDAWDAWREGREVEAWGQCWSWEIEDDE